MDHYTYSNNLLSYIKSLKVNDQIAQWVYKGKTDQVFTTPGGQWPAEGYLFEKVDKQYKFIIRSFPKEKGSYIVMESINMGRQLYNISLSDKKAYMTANGRTFLLESYSMTVGKGRKKSSDVEKEFKKQGVKTNVISEMDDNHPSWKQTLIDILQAAINRENVKKSLHNKGMDMKINKNHKESFKNWLSENFNDNNGTNSSYIRAIDIISKITQNDIFEIDDLQYLQNIYQEALAEQKKENGKYFFVEAPSYGKNGFYSASLKTYIQYLQINSRTSHNSNMIDSPLNQILYGPPGTGKTYNTINKAVCLIHPDYSKIDNREILKAEYELLVASNQIAFTTFHQSMSYEDFIEGIKPQTKNDSVTYSVKDGIFKNIVKMALSEFVKNDVEIETGKDDFDLLYDSYVDSIRSEEGIRKGTFTTKTGIEMMLVKVSDRSIIVKYLWDNNKTKDQPAKQAFAVSKEKLKKVLLEGINPSEVKSLKAELDPIIGYIHCELFAVYKSFYDFVIANKGEVETVHFNYQDQSYDEIKEQYDALDKEVIKRKLVKPYVLIIDEINRGNVSQIFGELITLIEESKRLGSSEELEVTLPYSKDKFSIPSNLYIIGTMNTADRSIEALDTALRRRFSFVEMMPDLKKLNGKSVNGIILRKLLETINKRIEVLLGRDHTIGHSYFINILTEEQLKSTFKNNIIPLLQEYFYGDYEKIGMILGNGFFEEPQKFTKNIFADFATQNYPDGGNILNLKVIDDSFDIITALETLMKKPVHVNG